MTPLNHTNITKQDVAKQCETIRNYIKLQKQFTFAKVQSPTIDSEIDCKSGITRAVMITYRTKVFCESIEQFIFELNQRDDGGVIYSKKIGRDFYHYHKGHLTVQYEKVLDK